MRTVAGFRLLGAGAPRGAGEEDLCNGGGKCSEVQWSAGVQGADAAPRNFGQSTIVVSGGGSAGTDGPTPDCAECAGSNVAKKCNLPPQAIFPVLEI